MTNDILTINTDEIIKFNTKPEIQKKEPIIDIPIFNLVSEDHPILKEVLTEFNFDNPPVNPNAFASSLVETCIKNNGFGLSANQCGFPYRVFVMGSGQEYIACFNPKVIKEYDTVHMVEGCLSFPLLALSITRAKEIDVEYQDFTGTTRTAHFNGISARCFLHELDHMNGIVYTNRAKPIALQQGIKKRGKIKSLINKAEKNLNKLK